MVVYNAEEALKRELHQQDALPVKHRAFEETKYRIKIFEVRKKKKKRGGGGVSHWEKVHVVAIPLML